MFNFQMHIYSSAIEPFEIRCVLQILAYIIILTYSSQLKNQFPPESVTFHILNKDMQQD